ncbi:hypothetical protein [uncultured Ruegeria sp.]|uniref:hypothetical protein n=1 Tax=uncultured Ruegeria sp. TaxID=259304 RepID=UPI0026241FB3|nr:hypothetical protein [uncultured Ruegeria sp.]
MSSTIMICCAGSKAIKRPHINSLDARKWWVVRDTVEKGFKVSMATIDDLRNELTDYDGRNPSILSEIAARHEGQPWFLSSLADLVPDEEVVVSEGATWIIKAMVEKGHNFMPHDVERLVTRLDEVTAWQAQLHICQSLVHMSVPQKVEPILKQWLNPLLDAPRPFVRAWATDALCRLCDKHSDRWALLDRMSEDEAASVRSRVRSLMTKFEGR